VAAFGKNAYLDMDTEDAALLPSAARSSTAVSGSRWPQSSRSTALTAAAWPWPTTAHDLVISVAAGQLDDVDAIAARGHASRKGRSSSSSFTSQALSGGPGAISRPRRSGSTVQVADIAVYDQPQ
jgi:hypothetical protein